MCRRKDFSAYLPSFFMRDRTEGVKGVLYHRSICVKDDGNTFCSTECGACKGEKGLKIDSANIGMESARSYRASNVTVRRFAIMDYQAELTQGGMAQTGNGLNAAVSDSSENAQEQMGQTTDKSKQYMEDWQNRFNVSASRVSLRTTASDTVNDIRQYTLRYIFDMLFAERRERFRNWLEGNREQDMPVQEADTANQELS